MDPEELALPQNRNRGCRLLSSQEQPFTARSPPGWRKGCPLTIDPAQESAWYTQEERKSLHIPPGFPESVDVCDSFFSPRWWV